MVNAAALALNFRAAAQKFKANEISPTTKGANKLDGFMGLKAFLLNPHSLETL